MEQGDYCERKNGRGVDINRNWILDWGVKEKDFDPYEENPGKFPLSEPEATTTHTVVKEIKYVTRSHYSVRNRKLFF